MMALLHSLQQMQQGGQLARALPDVRCWDAELVLPMQAQWLKVMSSQVTIRPHTHQAYWHSKEAAEFHEGTGFALQM